MARLLGRVLCTLGLHWCHYFVHQRWHHWHRKCTRCGWEQKWIEEDNEGKGHWMLIRVGKR